VDVRTAPARLRTLPSWLLNQVALPAQRIIDGRLDEVGARRWHYAVLTALEESARPARRRSAGGAGSIGAAWSASSTSSQRPATSLLGAVLAHHAG
jgi:hypothetical protein